MDRCFAMDLDGPDRHSMDSPKRQPDIGLKDEILHEISASANVAQFVSFGPDLRKRFHLIRHCEDLTDDGLHTCIETLLKASPEHKVNVRTFQPNLSKSTPFVYGLNSVTDVAANVTGLAHNGFYTIVNETIDMANGGT